jgi:hypothetical protein
MPRNEQSSGQMSVKRLISTACKMHQKQCIFTFFDPFCRPLVFQPRKPQMSPATPLKLPEPPRAGILLQGLKNTPARSDISRAAVSSSIRYLSHLEGLSLNRIGFGFRSLVCAALLLAVAALTPQLVSAQAGPVPPAILAAKTIFVSNAGGDSGLFPSPFSGDQSRGYTQFYAALKATGQFELVADPASADLVLELQLIAHTSPLSGRPDEVNKVNGAPDPLPMFRLVIYDRKTHYILWTFTESVERAFLQKTHDRNFDDALSALLQDFRTLAGKAPAAAR